MTVVQVACYGEMPNPLNPSSLLQFSGLGTAARKVNIYEMPDTGNINISFVDEFDSSTCIYGKLKLDAN